MCFFIEASFGNALIVGGAGIATLPHIRQPNETMLGTLPLMFAAHQLVEGVNGLVLEGRIDVGDLSILVYTVFAYALLPAIGPWSFWLAEPIAKNRRRTFPLVILGSCFCVFVLWEMTETPASATIRGHGIDYKSPFVHTLWFPVLYVISTCAPPFLSSYPWLKMFGVLVVATLIVTALFKMVFLTSVWCLAASLVSVLIYIHFRRVRRFEVSWPTSPFGSRAIGMCGGTEESFSPPAAAPRLSR